MADVQDEINEVKAEIKELKAKRNKAELDGDKQLVLAYTNEISELQRKENILLSRPSGNPTPSIHSFLLIVI